MIPQFVYVLSGIGENYYAEMLQLSVYSLRRFHPDASVLMVSDEKTVETLIQRNSPLLKTVTPIPVKVPEEYDEVHRSRFLKTQLRQIVIGNFLFLDVDTLVCSSLDEIINLEADIAMVRDIHGCENAQLKADRISICTRAGFFGNDEEPYFNSGVMWVKDTPAAHGFFSEWHRWWIYSWKRNVPQDQPALCQTNRKLGHVITEIAGKWNCMTAIPEGLYHILPDAGLIHYFNSRFCVRQRFLNRIRNKGRLDGFAKAVARHPQTIGVFIFMMGDMNLLREVFSHNPFQQDELSPFRWLQFAFMFFISKIIYWFD